MNVATKTSKSRMDFSALYEGGSTELYVDRFAEWCVLMNIGKQSRPATWLMGEVQFKYAISFLFPEY